MDAVRTINLWDMIKQLVKESQQAIEAKHLHFRYRMERVTVTQIDEGGEQLRQILKELVMNATAFTPEGGDVILCVTELMRTRDYVTLECYVQDDGKGMTGEEKEQAFSNVHKNPEHGLARVVEIIKDMDARISCESAPGMGTVVRVIVKLRCTEPLSTAARDKSGDLYNFTGKTVLLVEDHMLNLEIARDFLEQVGIRVETALNGEEAVRICQDHREKFDLILMDIRMPVMDGLEATRSIRQMEKNGREVPIVALTASAYEGDSARSRAAGMNETILKPIDPSKLYGVLRQYMFRRA